MATDLITPPRAAAAIAQADAAPFPPVDVVTLFCGRWYAWRPWFDSLLALFYPRDRLRLWWYCNSRDPAFAAHLATTALQLAAAGWDVRLTLDPTLAPSRNALRELRAGEQFPADHCDVIAALYNRATALTDRDLFFFEDDAGIPHDSLLRLQDACHRYGAGYAVGRVHDRHGPELFSWALTRADDGTYQAGPVAAHRGVQPIGLGGFTCTYVPRWAFAALSAPKFKPYPPAAWQPGPIAGCDMVLCMELDRLEIARVCDFDLRVAHYDSQGRPH